MRNEPKSSQPMTTQSNMPMGEMTPNYEVGIGWRDSEDHQRFLRVSIREIQKLTNGEEGVPFLSRLHSIVVRIQSEKHAKWAARMGDTYGACPICGNVDELLFDGVAYWLTCSSHKFKWAIHVETPFNSEFENWPECRKARGLLNTYRQVNGLAPHMLDFL